MCTTWDMYDAFNSDESKNSLNVASTSDTRSVSSAQKESFNFQKTDTVASNKKKDSF